MNWLWFSMGALSGLFYLFTRKKRELKQSALQPADAAATAQSLRENAEEALAAGDLTRLTTALEKACDPILQDVLLARIVAIHYRQRSEQKCREAFYRYAVRHIEMAPILLEAMAQAGKDRPERIESYKMLAIAMEEDGRHSEAIALCKSALSLGLENGTKTGFEGRVKRLERKKSAAAS